MTQTEKGSPGGSHSWPPSPGPVSGKTVGGGGCLCSGDEGLCHRALFGKSQARAGRTVWGPAHPQVSLATASGRGWAGRDCPGPGLRPQGADPEEKKLQTSERGEAADQALGMGVRGGMGEGFTEAPRASPGGSVLSSSPQVSCQPRKHSAFREESFWRKYWLHIEPSLFRRGEGKPGGRNREAELQDPLLCLWGYLGPWRCWWEAAVGEGSRQAPTTLALLPCLRQHCPPPAPHTSPNVRWPRLRLPQAARSILHQHLRSYPPPWAAPQRSCLTSVTTCGFSLCNLPVWNIQEVYVFLIEFWLTQALGRNSLVRRKTQ